MAVTSGMFLFEVVVEKVNSLVPSRHLIIKSDFGEIFSLELKDPKTMHIVMPEPPPLPPEPAGKKKKKPKPKPKKGKKGAAVVVPEEPAIQSGQSVLFGSSAEFLIQSMAKCPLEVSLWSKEDNLTFIGSVAIPWDPIFVLYLKKIADNEPAVPVVLKENYNIFEEGKAKMMAKIGMQVKLSFLTSKLTTSFRTLSEDPAIRKYLYTGINCKTTSYMCTLKTTDEDFEQNSVKIPNNFTVDKPSQKPNKINYADFKNAPGANLTFFNEGDYCCMKHADKRPESIYHPPETCPDVDHIIDYVRKIIVSCNDNMRMLTPKSTIRPRIKATDIDRFCYCRETNWPEGELAERFKKEALSAPCPICIDAGQKPKGIRPATLDIGNIRGPCGKPDCRVARDIRAYIENLVEQDNEEFNISDLIGPCGSKDCTLAEKIQDFLNHRGAFSHDNHLEGLSTQCACIETMQNELTKRETCDDACSKDCYETGSEASSCKGEGCPYKKKVYNVYYFTVEHDFDKKSETPASSTPGGASPQGTDSPQSEKKKFPYCPPTCPSVRVTEKASCSKTTCSLSNKWTIKPSEDEKSCVSPECPPQTVFPPSPADSNIEIYFYEINNPCCVKSCDVAEQIKDFIEDSVIKSKRRKDCADKLPDTGDPCYCDCVCTFKFSSKTTYCPVCGGYQCIGDDVRNLPEFQKPHPCPVYHKLYDKKYIKTPNPWPDEEKAESAKEPISGKGSKMGTKSIEKPAASKMGAKSIEKPTVQISKVTLDKDVKTKDTGKEKSKKSTAQVKKVGKFTANVEDEAQAPVESKPETKYPYPPVPKNMGWNWTAEDIPGLKVAHGWKPGAISKRLLRKLNNAKNRSTLPVQRVKIAKKVKKHIEDKPTLIVCKKNGEYHIEMQVSPENSDLNIDQCSPLKYVVRREDNDERVQKRLRKKQRLIKKAVDKVWSDPYHPEVCEQTCLRAYKQAVGLLPFDPNNPACTCPSKEEMDEQLSCSCEESDTSSSGSSLDLQWEIHFSPPSARN